MWLHKATGEQAYLAKAEEFLNTNVAWALSWDDKNIGAQVGRTEPSDYTVMQEVSLSILSALFYDGAYVTSLVRFAITSRVSLQIIAIIGQYADIYKTVTQLRLC